MNSGSLGGAASFVIAEAKTPATELALQDAVLLDEVVDNLLLLSVKPTGDDHDEELPGGKSRHADRC